MKRLFLPLIFLLIAPASATTTNLPTSSNRPLTINQSSAKIPTGKLTLILGTLHPTNNTYHGDFQMKVTPYFFKSEKGIVTIDLTSDLIAKAAKGQTIEVKGVAKTEGKNGPSRPITAFATPIDTNSGSLSLSIQDGSRKLNFQTDYRFLPE